jgi:hypothetical protein
VIAVGIAPVAVAAAVAARESIPSASDMFERLYAITPVSAHLSATNQPSHRTALVLREQRELMCATTTPHPKEHHSGEHHRAQRDTRKPEENLLARPTHGHWSFKATSTRERRQRFRQ